MDDVKKLLRVLWPIILASVCLTLILNPMDIVKGLALEFSIPLYFVTIPVKIERVELINIFLFFCAIVAVLYSFFRNYSFLLPTKVTFDVFYDKEELNNKIKILNSILIKPLPLFENWEDKRTEKFKWLDSKLNESTDINKFFSHQELGKYLSSKGKAEHGLVFHKQWQRYEITKVSGEMLHVLHVPNEEPIEIETRYYLLNTNRNYINVAIFDFFSGRCMVRPIMAQSLLYHSRRLYEIEFSGVTFVRIFPFASLEFTIFCFEENSKFIPMAYAIYRKGT